MLNFHFELNQYNDDVLFYIVRTGEDDTYDVNEGDDISIHSLPMMPVMPPIARAESRESLHSITKQSKLQILNYLIF